MVKGKQLVIQVGIASIRAKSEGIHREARGEKSERKKGERDDEREEKREREKEKEKEIPRLDRGPRRQCCGAPRVGWGCEQ